MPAAPATPDIRSMIRPERKMPREGTVRSEVRKARAKRPITRYREMHILQKAQEGKLPPEKALLRLSGETRAAVREAATNAKKPDAETATQTPENVIPAAGTENQADRQQPETTQTAPAKNGEATKKTTDTDKPAEEPTTSEETPEAKAKRERQERIDTVTKRVEGRFGENINDEDRVKIRAAVEGIVDQFEPGSKEWIQIVNKLDKIEGMSLGKRQVKDIMRLLDSMPVTVAKVFRKAGKSDEADEQIRIYEAKALTATAADIEELKKKFHTSSLIAKLIFGALVLIGGATYEGLKANSIQDLVGSG